MRSAVEIMNPGLSHHFHQIKTLSLMKLVRNGVIFKLPSFEKKTIKNNDTDEGTVADRMAELCQGLNYFQILDVTGALS